MPRAENFGDLISADHKVLSEESESRNNHRYAEVLQDPATQWLQSFPCKTKTSQETSKNLLKFLEPSRKPKVIFSDNSFEFGKSCEEIIERQPHRSETNRIAESVDSTTPSWPHRPWEAPVHISLSFVLVTELSRALHDAPTCLRWL